MAIALSGLVKAALAWRAGEKEMIGEWVGGGEGSFVFVLVLYSVFAWILYFVHMCVVGGREGYVVFVLCICICMISVGLYNSPQLHVLCPNSVGGWTMMLAKSGIWRVRSVFNGLLAGPTHFVR